MTFVETHGEGGPLCPNIGYPGNEAHALKTRFLNELYKHVPQDENDEVKDDPVAKAYHFVAYGTLDDRMSLYTESRSVLTGTIYITVEAWWFKCNICGLILPASVREN